MSLTVAMGFFVSAEKIYQYDVRFTNEDKANEDLFSLKKHRELRIQIFEALIENHWKVGHHFHVLLSSLLALRTDVRFEYEHAVLVGSN